MKLPFRVNHNLNPLLGRELRGRWRQPISPAILFLYAAGLAWLAYQLALPGNIPAETWGVGPGRQFLRGLLPWQIFLFGFGAPLVCCGCIATEREKSMLTGLVLTGLRPGEIVVGK